MNKSSANQKKVAFFDIDGTVFRSAVMMEVVDRMIQEGMLPQAITADVIEARNAWKNRQGKFETYDERFINLIENEFEGVEVAKFEELAAEVIGEVKDHQYRYTHGLMRQFRDRGYLLVAISGTLQQVLDIYNRHLGFDHVYAGRLSIQDGKFQKESKADSPYYDKAATVRRFLKEHPEATLDDSYGVGDTETDIKMLELVSHPIAFNPNMNLFNEAQKRGWEIVVERKDVIYHLHEGGYSVEVDK